jgi:hypothetical protein
MFLALFILAQYASEKNGVLPYFFSRKTLVILIKWSADSYFTKVPAHGSIQQKAWRYTVLVVGYNKGRSADSEESHPNIGLEVLGRLPESHGG